jgi:hypothetical protein
MSLGAINPGVDQEILFSAGRGFRCRLSGNRQEDTMTRLFILFIAFGACLAIGCQGTGGGDDDDTVPQGTDDGGLDAGDTDADGGDVDGGTDTGTGTGAGCSAIDLLFVIDNSGSMAEEQTNLADNFPKFIEVLDAYETPSHTKVDYRVGVTTCGVNRSFKQKIPGFPTAIPTTSTGPDGALQGQTTCGLGTYPWVESGDPEVSTKFSCMATQGTSGSGNEMPLAAIELAFGAQSKPGKPNEGFYDKGGDSLLVIVVITDEDDCSIENGGTMATSLAGSSDCNEATSTGLYDVAESAAYVNDVAGGDGRFVVVGIGGAKAGGCTSAFGSAIYAKRLKEFVTTFGGHGVFGDVCSGDLQVPLEDALDLIKLTCDEFPPVD